MNEDELTDRIRQVSSAIDLCKQGDKCVVLDGEWTMIVNDLPPAYVEQMLYSYLRMLRSELGLLRLKQEIYGED